MHSSSGAFSWCRHKRVSANKLNVMKESYSATPNNNMNNNNNNNKRGENHNNNNNNNCSKSNRENNYKNYAAEAGCLLNPKLLHLFSHGFFLFCYDVKVISSERLQRRESEISLYLSAILHACALERFS